MISSPIITDSFTEIFCKKSIKNDINHNYIYFGDISYSNLSGSRIGDMVAVGDIQPNLEHWREFQKKQMPNERARRES